ncbi:MAG: sigma-70 family RNA polymerase sigma factor [Bacteroidetes bacterium]|nr:sigma-70 family RNA polymerase sigma factor [Bacteroidota bacterium]
MIVYSKTDRDLIQSYILGSEKSFEVLLLRYKDVVFKFILSKVRDSALANDIFQDTFVKVINTLKSGNYKDEGKFLSWVMRISSNLVIDHFRRQNKIRMISETNPFDEEYSIFHKIASDEKNYLQQKSYDELESQMIKLIDYLPKAQKEIVEMRIFRDMSFKEIAFAENISINTALGRMRYALINIRKIIEKKNLVTDIS